MSQSRDKVVVQLLLSPQIGGAERLAEQLNERLPRHGFESSLAYVDSDASRSVGHRMRRFFRTRRQIKKLHPDFIISHSLIPNAYARLVSPRGTRIITVLHSGGDDYLPWVVRFAERVLRLRTHEIVAVSESVRRTYTNHFGSRRLSPHVISNGIDLSLPLKEAAAALPRRVVCVARMASVKRPELWLATAKLAEEQSPDWVFEWWGPSPDEPAVRSWMQDLDAKDLAHFKGPIESAGPVLENADVMLHTSSREAQGISLLEAAAVGLPIICASEVGPRLPASAVCFTFDESSPESVLRALREAEATWEDAGADAIAAALNVRQVFDIEETIKRYVWLCA